MHMVEVKKEGILLESTNLEFEKPSCPQSNLLSKR